MVWSCDCREVSTAWAVVWEELCGLTDRDILTVSVLITKKRKKVQKSFPMGKIKKKNKKKKQTKPTMQSL